VTRGAAVNHSLAFLVDSHEGRLAHKLDDSYRCLRTWSGALRAAHHGFEDTLRVEGDGNLHCANTVDVSMSYDTNFGAAVVDSSAHRRALSISPALDADPEAAGLPRCNASQAGR
jgi:hypothetical protein